MIRGKGFRDVLQIRQQLLFVSIMSVFIDLLWPAPTPPLSMPPLHGHLCLLELKPKGQEEEEVKEEMMCVYVSG